MAFKPNYNQQRADRTRAKQAKREEKLKLQQERTARRKAGLPTEDGPTDAGPGQEPDKA